MTTTTYQRPFPHLTIVQVRLLEAVAAGRVRYLPGAAGAVMDEPSDATLAKIYTIGQFMTVKVGELALADLVETELPEGGTVNLTTWGEQVLAREYGVAA